MKHDESIWNFYRSRLRDIEREWLRIGTIRPKISVLAIDMEGDWVVKTKLIQPVLHVTGDDFGRAWVRLERYKEGFMDMICDQGYMLVALLHEEFESISDQDGGRLYCSMKMGNRMDEIFLRHYNLVRIPGKVLESGEFVRPRLDFDRLS
jgi:hypothetical protein